MDIHIHTDRVIIVDDRETLAAIAALKESLMPALDDLTREVSETNTVIDSAITLLNSLSDLIRANAGNPAALTQLANDLDAQQSKLAAAIQANTPAQP